MYLYVCEAMYQGYDRVDVDKYGYCTCGAKFPLPLTADENGNMIPDFTLRCPNCGASYGNRQPLYLQNKDGKIYPSNYGKDNRPLHEVLIGDETVSLVKESPKGEWVDFIAARNPMETNRSVLTFDTAHGLRPVRLEMEGREVNMTVTNIGKASSGLNANTMHAPAGAETFQKEMAWIQKAMSDTSSLAEAVKGLLRYPVLDSLYEERERQNWSYTAAGFWDALKGGYLQAGERSLKKAFPLPKMVMDLIFRGKVRFEHAYMVVEKIGPDLGSEMLKLAVEILGNPSREAYELALFLAERNSTERQRLKTYLTEEVSIYQGIEEPSAAWELLKDYIDMSKEMKVTYSLCPKSLKLRHDLAARNYRLVLEEIEREKFKEQVAKEEYARLAWTSRDGKWAVLVPKEAGDLVREGAELSHCVGSYAKYIIDGSKRICFLRKTEKLEKPLLTLTVNTDGWCTTYLGFDNREAAADELIALREWTKARNLKLWES